MRNEGNRKRCKKLKKKKIISSKYRGGEEEPGKEENKRIRKILILRQSVKETEFLFNFVFLIFLLISCLLEGELAGS
jgi:hypothetical protein